MTTTAPTKLTTTAPKSSTHKPRMKRGNKPSTYHIESSSRPGIFQVVDAHRLTCSCEAGRRKRACRHLHAAVQWHTYRKQMHAKVAATAARHEVAA